MFIFVNFPDDLTGAGDPVKGLWVPVVALDVLVDCLDQVTDAAKCASANSFPCDFGKPAFNLIEPRRTGGREMNVKPWMLLQPCFHFRRLMRRIVIHD